MGNKIIYIVIITVILFHPLVSKANVDVIQNLIAQADLAEINSSDSLSYFLNQTEKLISEESPKNLQLSFLIQKGNFLKEKGSYSKAIEYYNQALEGSLGLTQANKKGMVYQSLGQCYYELGKIRHAYLAFDKSEALLTEQNNKGELAQTLYHKSVLYKQIEEYILAQKTIGQTLEILEQWTNDELLASCYLALGEIRMLCCNDNRGANNFNQKAIDLLVNHDPSKLLANAYSLAASTKKPKEAILFYEKSIDVLTQFENIHSTELTDERALNHYHIAQQHFKRNHYRKAMLAFDRAYQLFDKIENIEYASKSLSQKGASYFALDEYAIGLPYLLDAHEMAVNYQNQVAIETTAFNLYKGYEDLADLENALKFYKIHQTSKDALLTKAENTVLFFEDVHFETEQKVVLDIAQKLDNELALLNQMTKFQSFKNSLLFIFGILFVSLGVIYMLYRKQNITNKLLNLSNNDLKKKNDLILVQNLEIEKKYKENQTLLLEIHHRVKNNLQAISSLLSLQANYLTDEQALSAILGSQSRVQSVALIHQKLYQRQKLYSLDVKDFMDSLLVNLTNLFNVEQDSIKLHFSGAHLHFKLDTAIPLTLIVNELMTNTFKYAFPDKKGGRIDISLMQVDQKIILTYADNGIGLERKQLGTGFGSKLIGLLCKQLQGEFEIKETQSGLAYEFEFLNYELDLEGETPVQRKEFVEVQYHNL